MRRKTLLLTFGMLLGVAVVAAVLVSMLLRHVPNFYRMDETVD